ncbi:MAG: putative selenoprotein [Acidobacteriaceae bacterium]|nr:putative selenoprotein [Acidobacteriaceae bacterium]
MRKFLRGLLAMLREIGDENAYQRYLEAHRLKHSREAWRRFSDERMLQKYARAKCC